MADNKKRDDVVIELDDMRKGRDSPSARSPMLQTSTPSGPAMPSGPIANNPVVPVLSYCASSIMMTVTNKFVLSGTGFNLNFFLLCVQVIWMYLRLLGSETDGVLPVCRLRDRNTVLQIFWDHTISRFQLR